MVGLDLDLVCLFKQGHSGAAGCIHEGLAEDRRNSRALTSGLPQRTHYFSMGFIAFFRRPLTPLMKPLTDTHLQQQQQQQMR